MQYGCGPSVYFQSADEGFSVPDLQLNFTFLSALDIFLVEFG